MSLVVVMVERDMLHGKGICVFFFLSGTLFSILQLFDYHLNGLVAIMQIRKRIKCCSERSERE